jgi:hypothetical protein
MRRRRVHFAGEKIKRMPLLLDAFRAAFEETSSPSLADHVAHVDRDGTNGVLRDVSKSRDPRSIGIAANPLGVNRWNGAEGGEWKLVRVCVGSLIPDADREREIWDRGRWARIAERHSLPAASEWRRDAPDEWDVVLLLPKFGGWLGLGAREFSDRYSGYARTLRDRHPMSTIVIRVHPRNSQQPDAAAMRAIRAVASSVPNVRLDTTRAVSEEQYDRTKLAASDWSTAVVQFVMRGIPVYNPDETRPGRMIAASAVGGDKPPDEVMEHICQTVFDVDGPAEDLARILRHLGLDT